MPADYVSTVSQLTAREPSRKSSKKAVEPDRKDRSRHKVGLDCTCSFRGGALRRGADRGVDGKAARLQWIWQQCLGPYQRSDPARLRFWSLQAKSRLLSPVNHLRRYRRAWTNHGTETGAVGGRIGFLFVCNFQGNSRRIPSSRAATQRCALGGVKISSDETPLARTGPAGKVRFLRLFSALSPRGFTSRIISCGGCSQKLRIPKIRNNVRVTCPACKHQAVVEAAHLRLSGTFPVDWLQRHRIAVGIFLAFIASILDALGIASHRAAESRLAPYRLKTELSPRDGYAWMRLGEAYAAEKRFRDAEKALEKAVALGQSMALPSARQFLSRSRQIPPGCPLFRTGTFLQGSWGYLCSHWRSNECQKSL